MPGPRFPVISAPFDPLDVEPRTGTSYPPPFNGEIRNRSKRLLGNAAGLSNFGVNLTRLPPGEISSQRHWHSRQDEFVFILSGELVLITERGETTVRAGQCIGFPAGIPDGHQLINRTAEDVLYLEIGDRTQGDHIEYPDIDLAADSADGNRYRFTKRDGTPY